jgi:hypothetical protein
MPETRTSNVDYRGYTLTAVERSPGWHVDIYPGPGLMFTHPAHVSAATKEQAFAKGRAAVDHHLSR